MSDRFITLMVVPERSDRVRKITIPTLYLRIGVVIGALVVLGGLFVFFDYLHTLSQVAENKKLRVENHALRADIQSAKGKLESLDQSVARLKSFAQKLRILGNLNSPEGNKLLVAPEPGAGGALPGSSGESEDSGSIEDPETRGQNKTLPKGKQVGPPLGTPEAKAAPLPAAHDLHSQLEYQRSLTLFDGAAFDNSDLVEQVAKLGEVAARVRESAEIEEQNFAELQEMFQDRVDRLLSTPSIIPTRGWISSEFGYRYNPFSAQRTFHAGTDIANKIGTPITAPADGLVTFVGSMGGFGQIVRIDHGYTIVTKYGHISKIFVKKGQRIKRGDKIAEMGSSGRSTGPHLHYQVEVKGHPVNPRFFILEDVF